MTYTFIHERCSDLAVATCCRVMELSTSGFYPWRSNPVSSRDYDDALLTNAIFDIHRSSRRSYGSPRVHAELRLGKRICSSRKRVERLMRQAGIVGIHRRKGAAAPAVTSAPSRRRTWSGATSMSTGQTACGAWT
jgi:hypothetical protein